MRRMTLGFTPALFLSTVGLLLGLLSGMALSAEIDRTYTLDADFDEGVYSNVVHSVPDQLQLDDVTTPFNFIWIAVSTKGTTVKINTETGDILGEYRTAPEGQPTDPSRTTVDLNGNVWNTNRAGNSVVHIGLLENNQCEDRNGNGMIDTSTGLGDVRPWTNAGGVDTDGGVETAEDECIIHYVRVSSSGTRHVSVNKDNDVWVSGTGGRIFDLIAGDTGMILRTEGPVGYGGYGGLIDGNEVIWSSNPLLRWDTALSLSGPNHGTWDGYGHDSYGLCIDSQGNVWNTALNNDQIRKFDPAGNLLGTYSHGFYYAQGCVVGLNDDVWVAHSLLGGSSVGHIKNDGTFVGVVPVGEGPTGVAVDAAGKIWAASYYSQTASRIDPALGPIGADGVTPVGAVDLTTPPLGGNLYNYSDMTGSTLQGAPASGSWTVVHDSGMSLAEWGFVSWTADLFGDGDLAVSVASSEDGVLFGPPEVATNGGPLSVADGRFLKVSVVFTRSEEGESPILYDLTITGANEPPVCDAYPSLADLWPPNHQMVAVTVEGVTDPDGDPITIAVVGIRQDEPVDTYGDGRFSPDGDGIGSSTAWLRAERSGTKKVPGNGRVYYVEFTAEDGQGGSCTGTVMVGVPHDQSSPAMGDGPLYDSTQPAP